MSHFIDYSRIDIAKNHFNHDVTHEQGKVLHFTNPLPALIN
ncbi:hypothetical protein VC0395_0571 [Vibrio cholerae O395]|uniref:Uncharacterized protein n=1 Tax=Vibrio cholerae serotype O1 (strain ATCC 39541 / Classical Ogawa 395 / O395) TaxID=345073 RepID=A0A0H3AG53_VIBC3|nr:hypothetical protein VC0395_0571 [Vibrio cholerae O395]ACP11518.1 hypothetical protein VC395_A0684 [Vibrio cholerae O395]EMP92067.1 hypothetical protein VC95412_003643 [Vibrio cholerae O1 str. 95412]